MVYGLLKSECVDLIKYLNEKCCIKMVYNHAGLVARQRVAVIKNWHTGVVQIVCATNAFGMGIDNSDAGS